MQTFVQIYKSWSDADRHALQELLDEINTEAKAAGTAIISRYPLVLQVATTEERDAEPSPPR